MELTFYIRLESPPKGVNHARAVDGKTAAKNWEKLTVAARNLGIKPLQDFVSIAKTDLTPLVGKKVFDGSVTVRKEWWFKPSDALVSVRKLISQISSDKKSFENPRHLIKDLQGYENILSAADARGSRFHFSPDFEVEAPVQAK